MSRLLIHIGFDKTGTTSIQRFLRDHQRPLSNIGLVYALSSCPVYPYLALNQEVLTSLFSAVQVPIGTLTAFGSYDNAKLAAQRWAHSVKALKMNRAGTLIISSEALYSLPLRAVGELRNLSRWITNTENFEDGVKILAYVSEPASRYRRAASQSILTGRKIPRPRDQAARHYIQHYLQFFGRQHVEVRAYDRSMLVNGSVVDDFLDVLRPRLSENSALNKSSIEENRSPSSEALLLCSVLRELGLPDTAKLQAFVPEIILFDRVVSGSRRACLDTNVHDYLVDSSPDYDWLQAEFGCAFGRTGARHHAPGYEQQRPLSMLDIFQIDLDRYRHLVDYFLRRSIAFRDHIARGDELLADKLISAPCLLD